MNPSDDLIQRQIDLETSQVEEGIAKLHSNIRKAEERKYSSSTFYAQKLLKQAIPEVAKRIKEIRADRMLRGKAAPALAEMARHTMIIDDETLAMIVLKVLFDCTISPKDRADYSVKVIDKVGTAVEQEAKWRWFQKMPIYDPAMAIGAPHGEGVTRSVLRHHVVDIFGELVQGISTWARS